MTLLLFLFLSPLFAAILAALVVMSAKLAHLAKPKPSYLLELSLKYAVIGAGASLVLTIVWMIWYEKTTGFSAGNAPLGWIFFYGPVSAALGQFVALARWWFKSGQPNVQA